MAYPPPVPPATRTDATVMATNHPADHNVISVALTEILNHVATMEQALYPIGTIAMTGSDIAAGNHLLCQGQAVSRTQYPEVFALYGTKYGVGDGANTFNLPSMQGRSPMGYWPGGQWATSLGLPLIGNANSTLPVHGHTGSASGTTNGSGPVGTSTDGQHWHQPANAATFITTGGDPGPQFPGQGYAGSPNISPNTGIGHVYMGGTGNSGAHGHTVDDHGHTFSAGVTVDNAGSDPANTNIHPCVVINFQMRMH